MEATLENVLKSIAHPGLLASSTGLSDRQLSTLSTLQDSSPGAVDRDGTPSGLNGDAHAQTLGLGHGRNGSTGLEAPVRPRGIEWSGVRDEGNDSHRLHSLPDNTLNP